MTEMDALAIERALAAVGELLAAKGETAAVVLVGGATLNLLGLIRRSTSDVAVIALAVAHEGELRLERADPFPPPLRLAITTVARDFGLPGDWMNSVVEALWTQGFPPGLFEDISWRTYGENLNVGLVGRRTLIALKLHAAADNDMRSVHTQDLLALWPTDAELDEAAAWVLTQDAAEEWPDLVNRVVTHVRERRQ